MPPTSLHIQKGSILAKRFRVTHTIGRGSFGCVVACSDELLGGVPVALKVVPKSSFGSTWKSSVLANEILTSNRIVHDHVVRFYEFFDIGEYYVISMEYVPGSALTALLGQGENPIPIAQVLNILLQCTIALNAVHQHGILHRDLKPSNILLTPDHVVKIADFGLAVFREQVEPETQAVGTLPYMAPEILTTNSYSARSDIYALGVVLYRMIAGCKPWSADSTEQIIQAKLAPEPPPAPANPACPEAVKQLCMKMFARVPDDRYQSAAELLQALRSLEPLPPAAPAQEPVSPMRAPRAATSSKGTVFRSRSAVGSQHLRPLMYALLALAVLLLALAPGMPRPQPQQPRGNGQCGKNARCFAPLESRSKVVRTLDDVRAETD